MKNGNCRFCRTFLTTSFDHLSLSTGWGWSPVTCKSDSNKNSDWQLRHWFNSYSYSLKILLMSLEQVKNEPACEQLSLSLYLCVYLDLQTAVRNLSVVRFVCFQTKFSCWTSVVHGVGEHRNRERTKAPRAKIWSIVIIEGDKHKSRSLTAHKDGKYERSGCSENSKLSVCCTDSIQCHPAQDVCSGVHIQHRCNIHLYLLQCSRSKTAPPPPEITVNTPKFFHAQLQHIVLNPSKQLYAEAP